MGAFDRIYSAKVPAVHPACTIAARIRFTSIEEGSHRLKINVVDADGNKAGPELEDNITVRVGEGEDSSARNLILNIHGMKLENYGDYRIDLAIDGRQEATLPLRVIAIPERK